MDWDTADIRVNTCGSQTWPAGFRLDDAWFREKLVDFDFWFVWTGKGFLAIGDDPPIALRRGMCLLLRPGDPCKAWQSEESPLGVSWIHFDLLPRRGEGAGRSAWLPSRVLETARIDFYEGLTSRIAHLWQEREFLGSELREEGARLLARLMRTLLAGYAFDLSHEQTDRTVGIDRHHREIVSRALEQLHVRYREIRTVTRLAASLGYSRDHFCRVFLAVTGSTPQRVLIRIRMDRAKDLLRHSGLPIAAIAERVGYRSVFPFSRQFKREAGCSPSSFRQRHSVLVVD